MFLYKPIKMHFVAYIYDNGTACVNSFEIELKTVVDKFVIYISNKV